MTKPPTLSPLWFLLWLAVFALPILAPAEEKPAPVSHPRTERVIEGWKVRVDERLLSGSENEALGTTALGLIEADLRRIQLLVPADRLEKLREVPIVLDLDCGELKPMQYHPSADWLENNGYERSLARCVHIPRAAGYTDPTHVFTQPSCLLHELAHAFHDQVIGFGHQGVKSAFARAQLEKKYEKVLFIRGGERRHYALTNHKEYFAEATEAWFGTNDFYPFVRSELEQYDPALAKVLREVWGK